MNSLPDPPPPESSAQPALPMVHWTEAGQAQQAFWQSASANPPPRQVLPVDDRIKAAEAWKLASEGTALLWRGDFQNARQLLQAMARRAERKPVKTEPGAPLREIFHRQRQAQAQRARTLGMLLLPFAADHSIPLRRAVDARAACAQAYGAMPGPYLASLRELQGVIGAYEWRRKGVEIPELKGGIHPRIYPHYGVFSPIRGEYVALVANTPLPKADLAFDIGTGTGVLAALLAQRGVARVIATDNAPRALACARDNLERLGLQQQVEVVAADLFPPGQADLVLCNPPWLPARPVALLDHAVYDTDGNMLRGFLQGLRDHLRPEGQGWLILSDLAELLGLRTRAELLEMIAASGLTVLGSSATRPRHGRAFDAADPLHAARSAEVTTLWRLGVA